MSQNTNTRNSGNPRRDLKDQAALDERAKKVAAFQEKAGAISHSLSGRVPCEVRWNVTPEDAKAMILRIAREWVDDFVAVTLAPDLASQEVTGYITLPKNSRHIINTEMNNESYAIRGNMRRLSPEIKEFMKKFCDEDKQKIQRDPSVRDVVAIEINIPAFFQIEFDEKGIDYHRLFEDSLNRRMHVVVDKMWNEHKERRKGRTVITGFSHFIVIKREEAAGSTGEWKPKRAFNAGRE